VFCVPALAYNLCFGARLTSKGVTCLQVGTELFISLGKAKLLVGSCVDNINHIHCELIRSDEGRIITLPLWHNRLGHPNVEAARRMARQQLVTGLGNVHKERPFSCNVCCAAKQHRVSHPPSSSRADAPCGLIHTDLMCPNEDGLLTQGASYVLTMLDDHSRYAEVALLSSKAEASELLKLYHSEWSGRQGILSRQ
jgi:hypothetical protein